MESLMELLIVVCIMAAAVAVGRWLVIRHLRRERIKRRLEEWVAAPPKEPK
jgi:Tfp pilus assembly protein FimT